jgi:hypothetical protein
MNGGVINENAALLHHFLHMAQAQWIDDVPTNAGKHHIKRVVQPLQDLDQGAVDATVAKKSMTRIVVYAYCDRTQKFGFALAS